MAGLEGVDIDNLSMDQMEALSRGETAGLLPEVSPVSEPKPEPKAEPKAEPVKESAKAEPVAKADDKKPLPADDDDDEPVPADPNTATIPYQKYAREKKQLRTLLKSLEGKMTEQQTLSAKERDEMREQWQRADERLKVLTDAFNPQQQQSPQDADPEPDAAQDVIAYLAWQRREMERIKQGQQKTSETFTAAEQERALHTRYNTDVVSYAQTNPEFWGPQGAYNGLLTIRAQTLLAQGYNEPQIRGILQREEKSLVQRAYNERKNPAQVIHEMAKAMGWRAQAPVVADPPPAPAPAANGHANGATATPSVVEEVERIQRGMAGSKSLADVGGAPQEISVEALASMSGKEFDEYYRKHTARVESLLGKRGH